MQVNLETVAEVQARLLKVLARAELKVLEGIYAFTEHPAASIPVDRAHHALALVRDEDVWSVLEPGSDAAIEPLRVFLFHFAPGLDNSGFVGWLASHLKAVLGTGVVVVCGFNSRRGGVFDYWCVPERIGAAAIAEVHRLRAPNGYFSPAS
jgi:hypothetical protein